MDNHIWKKIFFDIIRPFRRVYYFVLRPKTTGVKIIIRHGDKLLYIRNSYGKGYWTYPGGRVKKGETVEMAARREAKEEVSIDLTNLKYLGSYRSNREYKRDTVYCFFAQIESDIFVIDPSEIAEARWFLIDCCPKTDARAVKNGLAMFFCNYQK